MKSKCHFIGKGDSSITTRGFCLYRKQCECLIPAKFFFNLPSYLNYYTFLICIYMRMFIWIWRGWCGRHRVIVAQVPVQSVSITTKVVGLKSVHGEVYSIQHYLIKNFSDLILNACQTDVTVLSWVG